MNPICRIVRTSRLPEGRDAAICENGGQAVIYVRASLPHKRQRELVRALLRAAKRKAGVLVPAGAAAARSASRAARRVPWQGAGAVAGGAMVLAGLHLGVLLPRTPPQVPRPAVLHARRRPVAAALPARHPAASARRAARRDGHRSALPPGTPVTGQPRQRQGAGPPSAHLPLPAVTLPVKVRLPLPQVKVKVPPLPVKVTAGRHKHCVVSVLSRCL